MLVGMPTYPGGKNGSGVYQRIICQMPPHQVYIEPFLGSGAVARLKRPAALNIAIDLHAPVVAAFQKLLAGIAGNDLVRSPYLALEAFTGGNGERRPSATAMVPDPTPKWLVSAENGLDFLDRLSPDLAGGYTLVYCDPPYLMSTRSGGAQYECEMTDLEHQRLLRWAIATKCRVILSGYWSQMYSKALKGWRCEMFTATTRGGLAKEALWMNFPEPTELHDYRYLGDGFRERERIKRKKARWIRKLRAMPMLERQCLLGAIADSGI